MVINWMFFNHFYQVSAVEGSCVKSVKARAPWQCPTTGPSDFSFLNSIHLNTFVLDFFYHDVYQYDWMYQFNHLFHQTRLMGLL